MSRPKDWVKAWHRDKTSDPSEHDWIVYHFAYWLEGQDRISDKPRAHIIPAENEPDADDIARNPQPKPELPDGLVHAGQGFFDIEQRGEGWTVSELRDMMEAAENLMLWSRIYGDDS